MAGRKLLDLNLRSMKGSARGVLNSFCVPPQTSMEYLLSDPLGKEASVLGCEAG